MTEGTMKPFAQCLGEALQLVVAREPRMHDFADLLEGVDVGKQEYCVTTPEGRAFLRGGIHTPEGRTWLDLDPSTPTDHVDVGESDILRWALTAELMQLGGASMAAEKALSFVDQGLTLRDIKSKSAETLAERRWDLVPDRAEETLPEPEEGAVKWEDVEQVSQDLYEPNLVRLPLEKGDAASAPDRESLTRSQFEALANDGLVHAFERLKKEVQRAELRLLEIPPDDLDLFIEQGLTWQEIRFQPERELTERLLTAEVLDESSTFASKSVRFARQTLESLQDPDARSEWIEGALDKLGEGVQKGLPVAEALVKPFVDVLTETGSEDHDVLGEFVGELTKLVSTSSLGKYLDRRFLEALPPALEALSQAEDVQAIQIRLMNYIVEASLLGRVRRWKQEIEQAEREGRGLCPVRFYDLLVVSDFHIAAGNYPSLDGLARISPTEDFFFDDAFFRFLYDCEDERRRRDGYHYELVFNGDMIDFAQVVVSGADEPKPELWAVPPLWFGRTGPGPESLQKKLGEMPLYAAQAPNIEQYQRQLFASTEKKYSGWASVAQAKTDTSVAGDPKAFVTDLLDRICQGQADGRVRDTLYQKQHVQTLADWASAAWIREAQRARTERQMPKQKVREMHRREALGQLADVYFGHPHLFQGLAWFLAQGNRLVVIRGNHDPQWYWPEVQLAFIGWLKTAYDDLRRTCMTPSGVDLPVSSTILTGHLSNQELPEVDLAFFAGQVDFDHGWYYYRQDLAYIEHGGQHDAINAYRHFLIPVQPTPGESDQASAPAIPAHTPPGALAWLPDLAVDETEKEIHSSAGNVGMPLLNLLEIELPNFDRPGYMDVYLNWLLYRRPWLLVRKLGRSLLLTLRNWGRWVRHKPGPEIEGRHHQKREAYARLTGLPSPCARLLDETPWVKNWRKPRYYASVGRKALALLGAGIVAVIVLIVQFGLFRRGPYRPEQLVFFDWIKSAFWAFVGGGASYWAITLISGWLNLGEDYLLKPSMGVEQILGDCDRPVPYILFGHDHVRNAQRLPGGNWYINTGAWLHKYAIERKRLLREPLEYSFARMIDTHSVLARQTAGGPRRPRVELLRWNDHAGRVEPCETFRAADEFRQRP